jgi:hypothetical protein
VRAEAHLTDPRLGAVTLTPSVTFIGIYLREMSFKFGEASPREGLTPPNPEKINRLSYTLFNVENAFQSELKWGRELRLPNSN